jgi:hypothetical protein
LKFDSIDRPPCTAVRLMVTALPAKLRNKPKVVERWILAPLRDQRFFSLSALNRSIRPANLLSKK